MKVLVFFILGAAILLTSGFAFKSNLLFVLAPILALLAAGHSIATLLNLNKAEKSAPIQEAVKSKRISKLVRNKSQLADLLSKYEYNDAQLVPLFGEIKSLLQRYNEILSNPKLSKFITPEMLDGAENLFNTLVDQVEVAYKLGKSYQMATGESKNNLRKNRIEIIDDIRKVLDSTISNIDELVNISTRPAKEQMAKLSQNLNFELEVAMKTQKEFAEMGFDENQLTKQ